MYIHGRLITHAGSWLSLAGINLTSSYKGGTAMALEGTSELDAELLATFDAASNLTAIKFQIQICDGDPTVEANWEPINASPASTGVAATEVSLSVSLGQTVKERLQTKAHHGAKFCRIATKGVGAATGTGADASASNLNFSQ